MKPSVAIMKNRFIILVAATLNLALCSCGLPFIAGEYAFHGMREAALRKSPVPESKWNKYGWWRRISDNPPTYIAKNRPVSAPREKSNGTWYVDQRDGKRLFVPIGDDVFAADARVITNMNRGIDPPSYEGNAAWENLQYLLPLAN